MSDTMNMIFEPRDLEVVSPATVSRCGMIFVEPGEMGWQPMVDSWMAKRPEFMTQEHKDLLNDFLGGWSTHCCTFSGTSAKSCQRRLTKRWSCL